MNIMDPFLDPKVRLTMAGQFNLTACEAGCLDEAGLPIGDWQLLIMFLEKFGGVDNTYSVMSKLNETLPTIPFADIGQCVTMEDLKGPQAFTGLLGEELPNADPFASGLLGIS